MRDLFRTEGLKISYIKEYIDRRNHLIGLVIIALFIFAAVFLCSNLLVLRGKVLERSEKECVSASAISSWENSLNIANQICVESQGNYILDLKTNYDAQIGNLESDVKYWKDAYMWLKFQNKEEE